jgi:hypothetical protein
MKSTMSPTGLVTFTVRDRFGDIESEVMAHNIITATGDAYIADLLSLSPARQKINGTNCYVILGTGYTGANNKNQTWVNTQTGSGQLVSSTYPQLVGTWGNSGQNVLNFVFLFSAGSLNVTGINEACITSANVQGSTTTCLAYVNTPSTNVSISSTLQITWQITFLGT